MGQVPVEKDTPDKKGVNYYPFGLGMAGISDKAIKSNYAENKYRFGAKELQSQEFSDGTGLNDYDYGARFLDAQIGRWTTQDPFAEEYTNMSPYLSMDNNPLSIVDPTGKSGEPVIDKKIKLSQ